MKGGAATEAQVKSLTAQLSDKDAEIAQLKDKQLQQQRVHDNELAEMTKKQNIMQSEFAEMQPKSAAMAYEALTMHCTDGLSKFYPRHCSHHCHI